MSITTTDVTGLSPKICSKRAKKLRNSKIYINNHAPIVAEFLYKEGHTIIDSACLLSMKGFFYIKKDCVPFNRSLARTLHCQNAQNCSKALHETLIITINWPKFNSYCIPVYFGSKKNFAIIKILK